MLNWLRNLTSTTGFTPHGYCLLWSPGVLWTDVISNSLIAAAYYSIPFAMWYFLRRRPDLPFARLAALFALFILACGTTHLLDAVDIWIPLYRLDAAVCVVTAAASVATAIALYFDMPHLLTIPSRVALETSNTRLREEVAVRRRLEAEMRELNRTLEYRIRLRTAELQHFNDELRQESAERRLAQQRVLALNEQLEQRVADRTVQLQFANRELEAFSYSVAHDLRAPLRAIDGFSRALVEDCSTGLPQEGLGFIDRIRAASARMGELIDSLLALSRVTRGTLERRLVDLSALAHEVQRTLEAHRPRAAVTVLIEDGLQAEADPKYLRIVLENLLDNAWKYTERTAGARIEFGALAEQTAAQPTWFVRDNGAGFDMRYADKLFGVFQRLHTHEEFPGTGIGLATVSRIIAMHGGRIWAEARPGAGAAFFFTLGPAGNTPA